MKIENGKLILEIVDCWNCNGSGKFRYNSPCRNYGKAQGGKPCDVCGSKTKHGHKYFPDENESDCRICDGSGKLQEDMCSHAPDGFWASLEFVVVRSNRQHTIREHVLGLGAFSRTDYGRHKSLTDDEIIAEVKESNSYCQATNFTLDNGDVCTMGIFTSDNGYSVVKIPPQELDKVKALTKELDKAKQLVS